MRVASTGCKRDCKELAAAQQGAVEIRILDYVRRWRQWVRSGLDAYAWGVQRRQKVGLRFESRSSLRECETNAGPRLTAATHNHRHGFRLPHDGTAHCRPT
jgi:hypothetical protein